MKRKFAYLHGFGSGPTGGKAAKLIEIFKNLHDIDLVVPDLNYPSYSEITITNALKVIDKMDNEKNVTWCIIASSFGAYLATLWTKLNPSRVEKLVLLCPGFRLLEIWSQTLGKDKMQLWEKQGCLEFPDYIQKGKLVPIRYDLIKDFQNYPPSPQVSCPILMFHGNQDETIPIEYSKEYAKENKNVTFLEVADDHRLLRTLDFIDRRAARFLEI
eukprot:TRINITY_DN1803_c0_g1_i1.p1 TRINITY_DN1803_c0_g1~~TRINITY_DN1803_c0_g1_i1.p1  ORF type:complete len:215 (+),score=31.39 TRINITY_DN1803_c0_g1_i1:77-721(+)